MKYHELNPEQYQALMAKVHGGEMGPEVVFLCDAQRDDHLHVRRIGNKGIGLEGRVGVSSHSAYGVATLFFASAEARALAAVLLNLADELDGDTPLLFAAAPKFIGGDDLDNPNAK